MKNLLIAIYKVLIVVALFGLLSLLLLNSLGIRFPSENIYKNKVRILKLHMIIGVYKADCPNVVIKINILEILTKEETTDKCFKGPYIKEKYAKDVYNNKLLFFPNKGDEYIVSLGKDGIFGTKQSTGSEALILLVIYAKILKTIDGVRGIDFTCYLC